MRLAYQTGRLQTHRDNLLVEIKNLEENGDVPLKKEFVEMLVADLDLYSIITGRTYHISENHYQLQDFESSHKQMMEQLKHL